MIKVAPSILSADFSRLGEEVARIERAGADWIHVDVMDGQFVPNITFGPVVIEKIRGCCTLPFDVHLMILEPQRFIEQFCRAGADIITVHSESTRYLDTTLEKIRRNGKKAGVSVNPETPLTTVLDLLDRIDLILIMTVNPGFAGQEFMDTVVPKIEEARRYIDDQGLRVDIEVDGGINSKTAPTAVHAGANVLASGSYLLNQRDMASEIRRWKGLGNDHSIKRRS